MTPKLRATVVINAHYVPSRVIFLATVLDAILGWEMRSVRVILISNDAAIMAEGAILAAQQAFAERQWSLTLEEVDNLFHPFLLTWHHKNMIPSWISTAQEMDDYFIYIEDDIVITDKNIKYFSNFLGPLRNFGLIPGFLRYEFRDDRKYSLDIPETQLVSIYPTHNINGLKFVCPTNPYWAGFILDRSLAEEYVASESFDLADSERKSRWDLRARAAMGLTWETVPNGHKSRYAVPLINGRPAEICLVWHCAQNYSVMSETKFATLPIENAFSEGGILILLYRAVRRFVRLLHMFRN